MNKKLCTLISVICGIGAFATLGCEMFVTYAEDAAAFAKHFACGFNLPEFSPLGFIPMLTPIVLILLMFTRLPYGTSLKTLLLISFVNAISFNHSLIALHSKMIGTVKWIVHLNWGIPAYMIAITMTEIAVFATINLKNIKYREEKNV